MFASIDDVISRFGQLQYITNRTIATVVYLVNSGHARLIGNFRGARFDLRTVAGCSAAA